MLTILLLINPAKYAYHTSVSNMIQSALRPDNHQISILDINTFKHDYECLNRIKELQPDVLITLDLSGFHIRTQAGEIALNMLPTKNLNLIWGNKPEYASLLHKKLSLSMLFYDATGINHCLTEQYTNMLFYKALSLQNFQEIWLDFQQSVLL